MLVSILSCSSKAIFFKLKQITGFHWIEKDVCYSQRCVLLTEIKLLLYPSHRCFRWDWTGRKRIWSDERD